MTDLQIIDKWRHGYSIDSIVRDEFRYINKDYARVLWVDNQWIVNKNYTKLADVKARVERVIFESITNKAMKGAEI